MRYSIEPKLYVNNVKHQINVYNNNNTSVNTNTAYTYISVYRVITSTPISHLHGPAVPHYKSVSFTAGIVRKGAAWRITPRFRSAEIMHTSIIKTDMKLRHRMDTRERDPHQFARTFFAIYKVLYDL